MAERILQPGGRVGLAEARAIQRFHHAASRRWTATLGLLCLLVLAGVLALMLGSVALPPETIVRILLSRLGLASSTGYSPGQETIVLQIRLPRLLLAGLAGAALAIAGAVYQGLFRNPMGDPYLLGVAPGAGLGATIVLAFAGEVAFLGLNLLPAAAFLGALFATALIYSLARVERTTMLTTLLLAGVALGSLLSAVTSFILFARPERMQQAVYWLFGSFSTARWDSLGLALPYLGVGAALAFSQARALNLLLLDEEQAQHLGVEVERTKLLLVISATLLSAAAVAVSGPIGFVGLVAPHAARLLWGPDYRTLLPTSALTGALFLILADLFTRTVFAPGELPVGVVSALCGGPFFLYLLRRRKRALLA